MLMLQSLNGFHSGFSFLERSFTGTTNFNPEQISSTPQTLISTKPSFKVISLISFSVKLL